MNIIQFRENIRQSFKSIQYDIGYDRKSFFANYNNNIFKFLDEKEQAEISLLSFRKSKELKNNLLKTYQSLHSENRKEFRRMKVLQNKNLFLYKQYGNR